MLIAISSLILLLFFGVGGKSVDHYLVDIKKPVKQVVEDEGRRAQILQLSKDLEKNLRQHGKAWSKAADGFLTIQADHDATPEDFAAETQRIEELLEQRQQIVLTTRKEMRALMTEQEWEVVFMER